MEIIIEVIVKKLFYFEFVILQYGDEHNYNLGRHQQLWAMEKSTKGVGFGINQIREGGCIGRQCAGLARAVSLCVQLNTVVPAQPHKNNLSYFYIFSPQIKWSAPQHAVQTNLRQFRVMNQLHTHAHSTHTPNAPTLRHLDDHQSVPLPMVQLCALLRGPLLIII